MSDMKGAMEKVGIKGSSSQKKCKCGKPIKNPKFDTCYECSQKKHSSGGQLPSNYLKDGYFDEKGHLREGIFKDDAKEIARILAPKMSSTSFRVFYNKLKAIETKYKVSNNNFDIIKPDLYAFERDVTLQVNRGVVPEEFRKFIIKNADLAAKGDKEFKGFAEHFLSVLAYFKDASK